jgi:ADP-heptose:LPS heptosyltransferase
MADLHQQSILVFHIGSLGDTIVSIPALRALRSQWEEITLLHEQVEPGLAGPQELLRDTGLVDHFISYAAGGSRFEFARQTLRLRRTIAERGFGAVVYLMRSERPRSAARRDAVFFAACRIPKRIGFYSLPSGALSPRNPDSTPARVPNEAQRIFDRLAPLKIPGGIGDFQDLPLLKLPEFQRAAAVCFLNKERRHPDRPLAAICPGCKQGANRWPVERFIELARRLQSTQAAEIVLLGGPAEVDLAHRIEQAAGPAINCAGRFTVQQSAAVLEQCSFLIGLDTGTTHLASAVGTRCIGIYGGRNHPGQWEPMGRGHTILRHPVPCGGCGLIDCPVAGHPCLSGITVDMVWAAVQSMLSAVGVANRQLAAEGAFPRR